MTEGLVILLVIFVLAMFVGLVYIGNEVSSILSEISTEI